MSKYAQIQTRKRTSVLAAAALSALVLSSCAGNAEGGEGVATLKMSDFHPTTHYASENATQYFMQRAEELADGTLKFEHYPAEQLTSAQDQLDAVSSGLADVALYAALYETDLVPLASVCGLPAGFETASEATAACDAVFNSEELTAQFDSHGVKHLFGYGLAPYGIQSKGDKIDSLDNIAGLLVASSGGINSQAVQALDASPVDVPGPELFEGLDRGTVDAVSLSSFSIDGYDIAGQLDWDLTNLNLGTMPVGYAVNDATWESLTPQQQEALTLAGEEAQEHMAAWQDDNLEVIRAKMAEESGLQSYELPASELPAWQNIHEGMADEWARDMDSQGLPGTQVLRHWQDAQH